MQRLLVMTAAVLVGWAHEAAAEIKTFTIDSSQSYFSIELTTPDWTTPFSAPQTSGSDTTALSGTFDADLTGSSVQFLTTSDTQFALQAEAQAPLPDGSAGTAPA